MFIFFYDNIIFLNRLKKINLDLWNKHQNNILYYGTLWKFKQNPDLKEFLLSFPRHTIFAKAAIRDNESQDDETIEEIYRLASKNIKILERLARVRGWDNL